MNCCVEGEGFFGGGAGVGSRGGQAIGDGAEGDWVDEVALREAMSRAYATFALMHGSVSDALRAPVTIPPTGCRSGRGVGNGGTVSGLEVLRRLASVRKRLRRARRETAKVRVPNVLTWLSKCVSNKASTHCAKQRV